MLTACFINKREMGKNPRAANRKRVVMELVKGKRIATRLQTLLRDPVQDREPVSYEDLALQILRSFTKSLSELSYCSELPESTQIAALDGSGSTCSVESEKKPAVKDRRGCYKRRRTLDSWITVSQTMDDGHAWRKYGQKKILNSESPRCYFRCTHKSRGCKATKQVQKLEEDPFTYQTTYFNHHTCTGTLPAPYLNVDPDPVDPNLISFQTQSTPIMNIIISPMKEDNLVIRESKEDNRISEARPISSDPWQDILVGSGRWFGYQEVGSGFHSCGSTSFNGLDMEVNQLDDIGNFQFD